MKSIINIFCLALVLSACAVAASAQQPVEATATERTGNEPHVALTEAATAFDAEGRIALGGRLRTTSLTGTTDAPTRNVVVVIENRGQFFYNYVSGYATFYDASNVRCGEGLWKLQALAVGESAEVDTPGLRLTCTPATWRIVALNLLTRSSDMAKPNQPAPVEGAPPSATSNATPDATSNNSAPIASTSRLEININGKTLPLQLGNPVEIIVGKERVNIVVNPAP